MRLTWKRFAVFLFVVALFAFCVWARRNEPPPVPNEPPPALNDRFTPKIPLRF